MADLWRRGMGACQVCPAEGGHCEGRVQGHHVVSKQALRRHGLHEHLWDVRNRLAVCARRHERHTTLSAPIAYGLLPSSAIEFAAELGLEWWLDRHYPREAA